jgi:hypothetical protein
MEKLKTMLDAVPFLLTTQNGGHKFNITRLLEAAIIAVVTAVVVSYVSVEKINMRLDYIQRDMAKTDEIMLKMNLRILDLERKP